MAMGYSMDLPVAYEYNPYELPETIKSKFLGQEVPHWKEFEESEG
jgi:hypothetical protein